MGILDYRFRSSIPSPTDTPVQRFKCSLTTALAWLGARAARYSFPVRLLHSLLHAGLSRRSQDQGVCPTNSAELPIPGKVCDIALKRAPREARRPVLGRLRYLRSGVGDGLSIEHPPRALGVELLLPFRHHDSG